MYSEVIIKIQSLVKRVAILPCEIYGTFLTNTGQCPAFFRAILCLCAFEQRDSASCVAKQRDVITRGDNSIIPGSDQRHVHHADNCDHKFADTGRDNIGNTQAKGARFHRCFIH